MCHPRLAERDWCREGARHGSSVPVLLFSVVELGIEYLSSRASSGDLPGEQCLETGS